MAQTNAAPKKSSILSWAMAAVAVLFGAATLKSGGEVLFGSPMARQAAGAYVPFVVWFNFVAGGAYVVAGVALGLRTSWAPKLAFGIAAATALVFAAFGLHIATDGAFEMRTVLAMTLRTGLWGGIALLAFRMQRESLSDATRNKQ